MPVTISFFNNFVEDLGLGRMNLSADSLKVMLVNAYSFNATHHSKSQITGELGTANGYTAGGQELDNVSWGFFVDKTKLDADDLTWSATAGAIGPATGAVIYDDTVTSPTADRLIAYIDFGGAQTAGIGTDFKITFNADGVLTIQPA